MNETLAKMLPELSDDYRWNLVHEKNSFSNSGYIAYLFLERRRGVGPFKWWERVAREHPEIHGIENSANKIMKNFFNADGSELLGATKP